MRLYTLLHNYLTRITPITQGGTGASSASGVVTNLKTDIINTIYPVGSIYLAYNSTDPSTLFGGKWVQLKDKFLLGAGDTYSNGSSGGSATVTLETKHLPVHTHTFTGSSATSVSGGAHTHDGNGGAAGGGTGAGLDSFTSMSSTAKTYSNVVYSDGTHSHSVTPKGTNANTGGDKSHDNMPPYLVVSIWKRTA